MHILVVEDEPALCSYLVPMLEREGFTASAVHTGAGALAAINDRAPDLVLLDIGLPDVSGLEVCRSIRRREEYLPVVMLTGQDSPEDELRGFGVQADDYLTKPVVADRLIARLRAVLRLAGRTHTDRIRLGAAVVNLRGKTALLTQVWGLESEAMGRAVEVPVSKRWADPAR